MGYMYVSSTCMYPLWYISNICLSERVHLRLAREGKKHVYTLVISNCLYILICPNHFMLLMPGVRPGGVFASMLYCCIFR